MLFHSSEAVLLHFHPNLSQKGIFFGFFKVEIPLSCVIFFDSGKK